MEKEPNYSGSNSNEHNAKIILIFTKINGLLQENLRGHFNFFPSSSNQNHNWSD